jgi:hypothetical protein
MRMVVAGLRVGGRWATLVVAERHRRGSDAL